MAVSIGIVLASAVAAFARWIGLDRERAFYSTVMMVIASLYVLFAVLGGNSGLLAEAGMGLGFFSLAVLGFKGSPWWTVAALVGHGLFDLVHPHLINNGGVPAWWPHFCSAYDITAGAVLGYAIYKPKGKINPDDRDGRG